MSNIVPMGQSCEYLVSRAARHRRAGRYDEAMALLSRAKDEFGSTEEIELEMARVYDEMDCEEEAARAYLRVVRLGQKHRAQALFHLALSSAQRGDLKRAASYYEQFASANDDSEVSPEMAALLGQQLRQEIEGFSVYSRRGRAHTLEQRAVIRLQAGKPIAAQRALEHAIALHSTVQRMTLLACCHLLSQRLPEAIDAAMRAHRMAPRRVQPLCLLSDAYSAQGETDKAKRALYLAALCAKDEDDLLAVAMESAKHGDDHLTLRMTSMLLHREPFHTRAMMLRGCALANLGRLREAGRFFGRVSRLLPEDTVSEALYRLCREENPPQERLVLGLDVTRQEGVSRVRELLALLYADPQEIRADRAQQRRLCRLCAWAIRSPMADSHVTTIALIMLSALNTDATREVLLDALTDPQIADSFKTAVLQVLTSREGFKPYLVDFDGRLVRLAAGGISTKPARSAQMHQRIVQRVTDALAQSFPDAPQTLLSIYLRYLERCDNPPRRHEPACAAALEYVFHRQSGRKIAEETIAARYGVSARLCRVYIRRFQRILKQEEEQRENPDTEE